MKRMFILLLIVFFSACGANQKERVKIKGDDVGHFIFENFLQQYNNNAEGEMDFSFSGGGSQTGIFALLDNTARIVFSLKKLNNEDLALLKSQNIYSVEIPLVRIPLVVIANVAHPLDKLTFLQVQRIFSGFYRNWWQILSRRERKQHPAFEGPIDYCSLDSRNGEYFFFRESLNISDFNVDTRYFNHNLALLEYVSQNESAIGYISLPFYNKSEKIKALYTDTRIEAVGYLVMDQRFQENEAIQHFLYQLKTFLYQNQILLLQKGIKLAVPESETQKQDSHAEEL